MPKKFDFAAGPFENRKAFWDLLSKLDPDLQQRAGQLLWSLVFKNELPDLLAALRDVAIAESMTADYGLNWSTVRATPEYFTINNGVITALVGGVYDVFVEGWWGLFPNVNDVFMIVAMKKNGSPFWEVINPGPIVTDDEVRYHRCVVHHRRIVNLQQGDNVSVTLTRNWRTTGSVTHSGAFYFAAIYLGRSQE